MNDIYVWLIILIIVYLLPEFLGKGKKRKGKSKYKYPQFPDSPQVPGEAKPQGRRIPNPSVDYPEADYEYYPYAIKTVQQEVFGFSPPKTAPVVADVSLQPLDAAVITSGASPWQHALTPQVLANAIVFSEIISPPRAHRPIGRRYGGNR